MTTEGVQIFTEIYENCKWGKDNVDEYNGSSGPGSEVEINIKTYIPFLQNFIRQHSISTVADLGCGNFKCGPHIYDDLPNLMYTGYDAYGKLVDRNNKTYGNSSRYVFRQIDIINEKHQIAGADLCILKDVIQHWKLHDIYEFLEFVTTNKLFRYILICNCAHQHSDDTDIKIGDFRPLSSRHRPLSKFHAKSVYTYHGKEVSIIDIGNDPIPNVVIQTSKNPLPSYIPEMIHKYLPSFSYKYFNDDAILKYFDDHPLKLFPDIKQKFHNFSTGAHRSDLFRYYYLYIEGGLFIDSDAMIYKDITHILQSHTFLSVLAKPQNPPLIFQGVLACNPRNPIIYEALMHIYHTQNETAKGYYHIFCKELYNIIHKHKTNESQNIRLLSETKNTHQGDEISDPTHVDTPSDCIFIHYYKTKFVPQTR